MVLQYPTVESNILQVSPVVNVCFVNNIACVISSYFAKVFSMLINIGVMVRRHLKLSTELSKSMGSTVMTTVISCRLG